MMNHVFETDATILDTRISSVPRSFQLLEAVISMRQRLLDHLGV